jgi:succinate dehydrogenase/fumarate reductase cytochrome b subunit
MTEMPRATASLPPAPVLRAIAPLAALAYPGLIWCGPRLSPIFLAVALAVPAIGLIAAHRIGLAGASPASRVAAHLAVAAPPLFSMLGGWLDFQRALPFGSVGLWIPLWTALVVAALVDRRRTTPRAAPRSRRLAAAHAISAAAIMLFAAAHLMNHLGGLLGGDVHVAIMRALRGVYRHQLIEPVLLAAVAFQIATGIWLLGRKLARPAAWFDTLQTATGFYLMIFFLSHLSAVLRARLLRDRDTDWTWLAGDELLTDPWSARLVPYYFLAVIALAIHGACGLRVVLLGHGVSPARGAAVVGLAAAAATVASALIMLGLFRA